MASIRRANLWAVAVIAVGAPSLARCRLRYAPGINHGCESFRVSFAAEDGLDDPHARCPGNGCRFPLRTGCYVQDASEAPSPFSLRTSSLPQFHLRTA